MHEVETTATPRRPKEDVMITPGHSLRIALAVLALTGPTLTLTGCERKDGPAEELGEAIDDTVDDAKDAIDDATD
jgi:hypothetical protein